MDHIKFAKANQHRMLTRAAQTLLGICSGIASDGVVNDMEIHFLRTWLLENKDVASVWPGNVIGQRISAILSDGVIDESERDNLLDVLQSITGNSFSETGSSVADVPALPVDNVQNVTFDGRRFCLTGTFFRGTRSSCESVTEALGGIVEKTVSRSLDYLVIGATVTANWAFESYGRKIEKAVAYRESGGSPLIITERQWELAMPGVTP